MLTVSPSAHDAFVWERARRIAPQLAAGIAAAQPDLAASLGRDELDKRVDCAVEVAVRHSVDSERDLHLLALAHALHGRDLLARDEFRWLTELLAEPPGNPDTRVYRMHCRLSGQIAPPA